MDAKKTLSEMLELSKEAGNCRNAGFYRDESDYWESIKFSGSFAIRPGDADQELRQLLAELEEAVRPIFDRRAEKIEARIVELALSLSAPSPVQSKGTPE